MEFLTSAGDDNRWDEADQGDVLYPPKDKEKLKVMVQFVLKNKKLPAVLPEDIWLPSVEKKISKASNPREDDVPALPWQCTSG